MLKTVLGRQIDMDRPLGGSVSVIRSKAEHTDGKVGPTGRAAGRASSTSIGEWSNSGWLMKAAIETLGLTKSFGTTRAVQNLDLQVDPGEVFGFLGPNGAGKSTTIRALLDLHRPTSGTVRVLELDVGVIRWDPASGGICPWGTRPVPTHDGRDHV